jgi:hypothetical protein
MIAFRGEDLASHLSFLQRIMLKFIVGVMTKSISISTELSSMKGNVEVKISKEFHLMEMTT